ncbi:Exodeoxyribonuclease VII large subunit [Candidatus Methanoperedens nitroreducens]|uniref:Exodeoxyribonuclease VII large subunit n=1 Tax=Candidatus Methanoperedens nitratireducens TaxID=1392998 RepID=A0A062V846_9EURY|nr:exodeoxyribonuclease VII large subunit [Candidatus Methanoperedens nitroreducens]KCZ72758.1 Exodeoxyribonuclease VII large subunit [Candidatus Methanoperedens nitroreducens]MDJ1423311.1 exodeoxyribonuclease VII large subunit [Candidatus Methanoperedens sp.]
MLFEEKGIYAVHEFTLAVKSILTGSQLNDVWIRGEISNFTNHSSGHRYFTLKDKSSQLQCVMFRWYGQNLRFEPRYGMKVIILGDIDVYEQRGQYQFKVRAIRPDGIGELYKAYEQLKNKLESEGLFSPVHKKPLPRFPKKIGVATSPTGAVLHDILTVIKRRYPTSVLFIPTIVQGETAAKSIVRSISVLNNTGVDLIIMGRGGGSIEDLWAFNEEIVARAIFNSKIPIISAVGHETDYTIADFVADRRAPTPSAAAEIAVPDRQELLNQINRLKYRLIEKQRYILNDRISHLSGLRADIEPYLLMERLSHYMQYIDEIAQRQTLGIRRILDTKASLFMVHTSKLDAVSPLGTLSRGYSIVLKLPDKIPLRSIHDVEKQDEIQIIVNDGRIRCNVNDKEVYKWK